MEVSSTEDVEEWNGRTIEIDDAGTGDLVGDAFIGFHNKSTGNIIFRGIPVGLYNKENRNGKRPQKAILNAVKDGLQSLHFNKEKDRILLCRGNCFDLVREWIKEIGFHHSPIIVEGKLQDAVEDRFFSHLRTLGIESKMDVDDYKGRFFTQFNWVCEDFPNRERFVKRGFPSWEKRWRRRARKRYNAKKRTRKSIKSRANEILQQM